MQPKRKKESWPGYGHQPHRWYNKLISYVDYFGKVVASKEIADRDIIAMDENSSLVERICN